jgi:hypothetical protein
VYLFTIINLSKNSIFFIISKAKILTDPEEIIAIASASKQEEIGAEASVAEEAALEEIERDN